MLRVQNNLHLGGSKWGGITRLMQCLYRVLGTHSCQNLSNRIVNVCTYHSLKLYPILKDRKAKEGTLTLFKTWHSIGFKTYQDITRKDYYRPIALRKIYVMFL